ncbi:unnamed protein product [Urochloa humidicola]
MATSWSGSLTPAVHIHCSSYLESMARWRRRCQEWRELGGPEDGGKTPARLVPFADTAAVLAIGSHRKKAPEWSPWHCWALLEQLSVRKKKLHSITWNAGAVLPFLGYAVAVFLFYSTMPTVLKICGTTMLNLSLLT